VDWGEEISRGFVVAGGDGTVLLELAKEILDEVAALVGVFVEIALNLSVLLGGIRRRPGSPLTSLLVIRLRTLATLSAMAT
jgi:hypothetical protein